MNTIGNCMVLDTATETALISPKGGFGGIGGGELPSRYASIRLDSPRFASNRLDMDSRTLWQTHTGHAGG